MDKTEFILAIIAIAISLYALFAQLKRKTLTYEIITNTSLLTIGKELEEKLVIHYDGKLVSQVNLFIIRFTNTGFAPIEPKDYQSNIKISLIGEGKILTCNPTDQHPPDLSIKENHTDKQIILDPVLLNRKDTFLIKSLIANFDDEYEVLGRITGITTINEYNPQKLSSKYLRLSGIFLGLSALVFFGTAYFRGTFQSGTLEYYLCLLFFIPGLLFLAIGTYHDIQKDIRTRQDNRDI